jgi:hypothetical protein
MKKIVGFAAIALAAVSMTAPADAKGCIKGALIGGTAGHFAGHHGFLGAAAGCIVGRHEANKAARQTRFSAANPAFDARRVLTLVIGFV